MTIHMFQRISTYPFPTGTSSIVDERTHEPILSILTLIVEAAAKLRRDGHNVVLVSSGAVGVGLRRMDVEERPKNLPRIQVWTITWAFSQDIHSYYLPGTRGCWTMQTHEPLGWFIFAPSFTSGSDSVD